MSEQMLRRKSPKKEPEVSSSKTVSTGSTLLDLAISGGNFPKGGLPGGILVEIFGPASSGKTVFLSEIAGGIQRAGGEVMFYDPEGRLNPTFARLFDLDVDAIQYSMPNTIKETFKPIRSWDVDPEKGPHGIFADSLAALTTEWELEDKDQYGMRRAKEFSEQLRLTCRELVKRNMLLVCSNQIRQNIDAGYGPRYKSPGGEAIGFYSSVRLRTSIKQRLKKERKVRGKAHTSIVGVELEVEVFKNSIWSPYRKASVIIQFDYGVDDVRANLQFLKSNMRHKTYQVGKHQLGISLDKAATKVEEDGLERRLQRETIDLWREIEKAFSTGRTRKRRR